MVSVLKGTRRILRVLGLGNEAFLVIGRFKIENFVIYIIFVVSQIYAILPYTLFAYQNSQLMERINNPLYAIVGYALTTLIFFDFIRNKSITNETISFLENLVNRS